MKVLLFPAHLTLNYNIGSEPSWAYNIISRLASSFMNIVFDVVVGRFEGRAPPNVRIFEAGYWGGGLLDRVLFYNKGFSIARKLYRYADIVHHMFPYGFRTGFNPLAVLGFVRDMPFVLGPVQYPQEFLDITDYEWVSGKRGLAARFLYNYEKTLLSFFRKPLEVLHEVTLNNADAIIFDSMRTLELYRKTYPETLKGKILRVTPPGVEVEVFQYSPPLRKDYFEILTVGYLVRRKGIQYLIRAMPGIIKEFKRVRLKIVGDGPYKETLAKMVKRLGLEKYVEFAGRIPREKLPEVYARCDIYVHPSLSESFPSAIREAMAVGRPVVATRVGFVEEHISHNVNGLVIDRASIEALEESISYLLGDEDARLRLGANARRYAEEHFNYDRIAKILYNIYEETLSRGK